MASPAGDLLATLRAGAILAVTPTALALFELERSHTRDDVPVLRKWTRRYGKLALAIYGAQAVAELAHVGPNGTYPGRDGRGVGRIFVSNHRSMLDVFAAVRFLEGDFVARADMRHWPVIGFVASRVGTIWVDRESRTSGAAAVDGMKKALLAGRSILIYPEGTTFEGDEVRPFRSGAFRAARAAGAEIVPVGLAYAGNGREYGDERFFQHYRRLAGIARTHLALVAGEPLLVHPDETADALRARAHAEVQRIVHRARALLDR